MPALTAAVLELDPMTRCMSLMQEAMRMAEDSMESSGLAPCNADVSILGLESPLSLHKPNCPAAISHRCNVAVAGSHADGTRQHGVQWPGFAQC